MLNKAFTLRRKNRTPDASNPALVKSVEVVPDLRASARSSKRFLGNTFKKKSLTASSRQSGAFSSFKSTPTSEAVLLLGDSNFRVNIYGNKAARVTHHDLFGDGPQEEVLIRAQVEVRAPTTGQSLRNSFRATLQRAKKEKGEIIIGDGRICLNLPSKSFRKEIGHLSSVAISDNQSKSCTLKFTNLPDSITLFFESPEIAQEIVRGFLIEARAQCLTLSKALDSLLPKDWAKALQTRSQMQSSPDEKMLTIMTDEEKNAAEICMREMVDLSAFGRGRENTDYFEYCEQLGKWLVKIGKSEEGGFWTEAAEKGHQMQEERRNKVLHGERHLGQTTDTREDFISELRDPVEMRDIAYLRAKTTPPNLDSRVTRVTQALNEVGKKTEEKQDHYDDLL